MAVLALLVVSSSAAAGPHPRSALSGFTCLHSRTPSRRSVAVRAVMAPIVGTRSLSLKFELLQTVHGVSTSIRGAGDLGIWLSPRDRTLGQRPGDVWQLNKAVSDLDAPAVYRFRVTFRWLGARDQVLRTAVALTRGCVQRELRPDLLVSSVAVTAIAAHPHKQLYTAVIANRGATGAGPFQVLFTPGDGSPSKTRTIACLNAHSALRMRFVGPPCNAESPPTVVADASSQVNDFDRDNNAITVTCPAPVPS